MNGLVIVLMLFCAGISLASESNLLKIESDGVVRSNPSRGRTSWTGTILFDHALFDMTIQGQASLFSGPTLQKKTSSRGRLKVKDITVGYAYISLVSLGDITIRIKDSKGVGRKIKAKKVVFLFESGELLIDGKSIFKKETDTYQMPNNAKP